MFCGVDVAVFPINSDSVMFLLIMNERPTKADSTGFSTTKPPRSLKKKMGPTKRTNTNVEKRTPKMHLSYTQVASPRIL